MDPFLGEIRTTAFNFAPRGWSLCNGQLMQISQFQALFAVIGTCYGGDGIRTFALPNLQGRVPIHVGNGVVLGEASGEESHALTIPEMPTHTHRMNGSNSPGQSGPTDHGLGAARVYSSSPTASVNLAPYMLSTSGGSGPHNNMQPSLVVNYIIATQGIFPTRN